MKCQDCVCYYRDYESSNPYCHYLQTNLEIEPCVEFECQEEEATYKIIYEGYLFEGDNDKLNVIKTDSWEECANFYNANPDITEIVHTPSGMIFRNGEWM